MNDTDKLNLEHATSLVKTGSPDAVPILLDLLHSSDDKICIESLILLRDFEGDLIIDSILNLFDHKSEDVRMWASSALLRKNMARSFEKLIQIAFDDFKSINARKQAIWILHEFDERPEVPFILSYFCNDKSEEIQIIAIESLSRIDNLDINARYIFLHKFRSSDNQIQEIATYALQRIFNTWDLSSIIRKI